MWVENDSKWSEPLTYELFSEWIQVSYQSWQKKIEKK